MARSTAAFSIPMGILLSLANLLWGTHITLFVSITSCCRSRCGESTCTEINFNAVAHLSLSRQNWDIRYRAFFSPLTFAVHYLFIYFSFDEMPWRGLCTVASQGSAPAVIWISLRIFCLLLHVRFQFSVAHKLWGRGILLSKTLFFITDFPANLHISLSTHSSFCSNYLEKKTKKKSCLLK